MDEIILDTADPDDPDFKKYLAENNISYEIVNQFGPGGGCPEIKYRANRDKLIKLIRIYWQDFGLYADIKSVPKEAEMSEKFYKIVASQGGIQMRKLCQDKTESEIMAEYYEQSGFAPENIYIQNWENGVYKDQISWDEVQGSKISIGQILGPIQNAMDIETETGEFGTDNAVKTECLPGGEKLKVEFESGEKFIITISELS